ncbi:hypothetical protein EDEG_01377 [Edhazardia aedis USNM 41457]|uniref:Transmembrane protein n=1 Tax=Edhazardia aedis (strain USNM 41457) TaxID=1003232 RepID=J9D9D0_EDHAE|nr:hypothetical protein EDEG_01377 [Edhazardia aedis USNM 41457]|eukprot:EJW04386.1 hypothetical protein EDEG_01377 [Edhazardia aedis USNM 41457]
MIGLKNQKEIISKKSFERYVLKKQSSILSSFSHNSNQFSSNSFNIYFLKKVIQKKFKCYTSTFSESKPLLHKSQLSLTFFSRTAYSYFLYLDEFVILLFYHNILKIILFT